MFESMGLDLGDDRWLATGEREVVERLGGDLMAFVVDHPTRAGTLVASAAGSIHRRLPRPGTPVFSVGYVQWVATEPDFRRRGLARGVMVGLLDWFERRDVFAVELHATAQAESLYLSMGFSDEGARALRKRS
jgi:GNAT superfamily N-acetyltransferase